MAERWAVATGNANATATWDGGTLPTSDDDVYANGFTVTINANTHWKSANTTPGTTAVVGGSFIISSGRTLTLNNGSGNATAGTTTCITFNSSSGNSATLIGNPVASSLTGARYGANNASTGTLNIIGNPIGGAMSTSIGVVNSAGGTLNITGNPTGSGGVNAAGAANLSTGTLNVIGNPLGGTGSGAAGVRQTGSGVTNITGTVTGGSGSGGSGIVLTAGHCVVNGNVVASNIATGLAVQVNAISAIVNGNVTGGGTGVTAGQGIDIQNSATVTVNGNAIGAIDRIDGYGVRVNLIGSGGTLILNGKCISNVAPGVFGGTPAALTSIGSAEMGTDKIFPYVGNVVFINFHTATFGYRDSIGDLYVLKSGSQSNLGIFKQRVIA